jgi:hypothetical protein
MEITEKIMVTIIISTNIQYFLIKITKILAIMESITMTLIMEFTRILKLKIRCKYAYNISNVKVYLKYFWWVL